MSVTYLFPLAWHKKARIFNNYHLSSSFLFPCFKCVYTDQLFMHYNFKRENNYNLPNKERTRKDLLGELSLLGLFRIVLLT